LSPWALSSSFYCLERLFGKVANTDIYHII
jgi:hypothetical protein